MFLALESSDMFSANAEMIMLPVPIGMKSFFTMEFLSPASNTGYYQIWSTKEFTLSPSSWRETMVPFPSFKPGLNYICVLEPPTDAPSDGSFLVKNEQTWFKTTVAKFEVGEYVR